jgi:hypothetical protein
MLPADARYAHGIIDASKPKPMVSELTRRRPELCLPGVLKKVEYREQRVYNG